MNTKKDYERAAMIVRGYPPTGVGDAICDAFVVFFRGDNPRFDADRFRAACKASAVRRNRRRRSVRANGWRRRQAATMKRRSRRRRSR